jgi:hypothetical protein
VSAFGRNPCPLSAGIGVRFAQELVSGFSKNMQLSGKREIPSPIMVGIKVNIILSSKSLLRK